MTFIKTKHPGIYYRVTRDGLKIYYLRIKAEGRQTWIAAGNRISDAKDLWSRYKIERAEGRLGVVRPKRIKFRELSEEYFEYYKTKAKPRNWPRVLSVLKQLNNFFRNIEIGKITSWTVENYIRTRKVAGKKPGTINFELDFLRSALNRAIEWKFIKSAPKIGKLPVQERRARILTDPEIEFVLQYECFSVDHKEAIALCLDTGMRLAEMFYITAEDVDFDAGAVYLDDTKSLKPRSIPLTPRAEGIIRRRLKEHGGKMFDERDPNKLSNVFTMERKDLYKYHHFTPWRFHDLRHTFITLLLRKGVDPYTIMEISGHSRLEMVTRYMHTTEDLKREAISKLNNVVPKNGKNKSSKS